MMPEGTAFADQLIALKVFARLLSQLAVDRAEGIGEKQWGAVYYHLTDAIADLEAAWLHVDDIGG